MTTINEASTLSALGLSDQDISELHTLKAILPHDMEYVPVTTKNEAITYIKEKHLLVGVNAEGQTVGILYTHDWRSSTYHVVKDGKTTHTGSLKDALAFLPGKAKWYRSVKPVKRERGSEVQKERSDQEDFIDAIVSKIERIYGKKLRSEARKYAQEIRRAVGSAVTQDKREPGMSRRPAPPVENIASLKIGYDKLDMIAKSKTPFKTLAKVIDDGWSDNREGFAGIIASEVSTYKYDQFDSTKAGRWAQENPAATAKIVRFGLSKLRAIRDEAFSYYHKRKDPIEAEPYRLRVREAYEGFIASGKIESLTKENKDA